MKHLTAPVLTLALLLAGCSGGSGGSTSSGFLRPVKERPASELAREAAERAATAINAGDLDALLPDALAVYDEFEREVILARGFGWTRKNQRESLEEWVFDVLGNPQTKKVRPIKLDGGGFWVPSGGQDSKGNYRMAAFGEKGLGFNVHVQVIRMKDGSWAFFDLMKRPEKSFIPITD